MCFLFSFYLIFFLFFNLFLLLILHAKKEKKKKDWIIFALTVDMLSVGWTLFLGGSFEI